MPRAKAVVEDVVAAVVQNRFGFNEKASCPFTQEGKSLAFEERTIVVEFTDTIIQTIGARFFAFSRLVFKADFSGMCIFPSSGKATC